MCRRVGDDHDDSLFGWVVRQHPKGWLVCDDGSNETADFINLTDDELHLIAVKAAKLNGGSTSPDAVHLVAAQLVKNLFFGHDTALLHQTLSSRKAGLVVFKDGERQPSPEGFLAALAAMKRATLQRSMTIVQPQLTSQGVAAAHRAMADGNRTAALVPPEMLRQIQPGDALCIHGTLQPIHLRTRRYWTDRKLRRRAGRSGVDPMKSDEVEEGRRLAARLEPFSERS